LRARRDGAGGDGRGGQPYRRPGRGDAEPAEEQLPNSKDDPSPIVLSIWTNGRTDEHGKFEFLVTPGRYYVVAPDKRIGASSASGAAPDLPVADVTDEAEVKIDLH